ncbi:MAG TPA: penicillin-binding protein [Vicinamibacterales bacterium]|nr:penicillin-binding protein [Vicinamibacterales bacterium]
MNAAVPFDWRVTLKRRVAVVAACLALWVAGIEARLVFLQVIDRAMLSALANRQTMLTREAPAIRGDIVDRRGRILATSVDADTIYAVPSEIADPAAAARQLCLALGDCSDRERQLLVERLGHNRQFAYVRRQVAPDLARRVLALNLDGIGFLTESRRFYPNKELASGLLGYVGVDNTGLAGLESAYDQQIRGRPGKVLVQTDAKRHAFSRFERPPTTGSTVELTIDGYLQHVAERELHAGIAENHAAGGAAIILNPHTGEILAMANEPTFNPNAYREYDESERRNGAVQDLYEPGSTFKIVTASAAIEERVFDVDQPIDVTGGQIHIGGRVVHDTHNYGVLSFTDVIVKSSNVGAIKIGFKLGTDRLSQYVARYGFGRQVSRDFPGESPGIVWNPAKWTDSALASVSMGYQVGVTPLQMVAAVSAVANGGEYIEPRVVRAIDHDNRRYLVQPTVVRRAITPETAATLTTIMEGVVERGTARAARLDRYTIAGKTGTAAKLVNGRYSGTDYNASFVGFVPSRNPAVAIIVVTDSPHGSAGHTGGMVSAPVFKRIADATLRYLGVPPTVDPDDPILITRQADTTALVDEGDVREPIVSVVAARAAAADGAPIAVPDLRGLSAREAVRALVKLGLNARASGDGFVVSQAPGAGSPLEPGTTCQLVLARTPRRAPETGPQ